MNLVKNGEATLFASSHKVDNVFFFRSSLHTDEVGPMGDVDSNQILNTSQSTLVVRLSSKIDEQQLEIERLKSQISSLAFKSGDA